jgi:large subunit ribosomal protein L10
MTREEKNKIIDALATDISGASTFYITDISNLTMEKTSKLRGLCFKRNVKLNVAKNTLIQKAFDKLEGDYSSLYDTLKGSSAIMYSEVGNVPAKVIKEFRKQSDRPILKCAWIEESIYLGDENLTMLAELKSKNELIADVVALLQSPVKNVVSALQSGGTKLSGILTTLEERDSNAS